MTQAKSEDYGLVVRFDVLAGHEEAFDRLVEVTVAKIRDEEPGTQFYLVHREGESPGVRVFYELYRDEAAFEAHEAMPHVKRFLAEREQHLSGEPLVWRVIPTGGVMR